MPNALQRSALQSGAGDFASEVRRAMLQTSKLLADVGGANSAEVKAAGAILARSIRKQLSAKNGVIGGTQRANSKTRDPRVPKRAPSAPGSPPAVQTARTRRSVGQAVVDGVRRVGVAAFEGRLDEQGVDTGPRGAVAAGTLYTDKKGRRRKHRGKKAAKGHHQAPRPFMERAYEAAQSEMTDVYVAAAAARVGA